MTIRDDLLFELIDEDFTLSLSDHVNVTIGEPSTTTVTIVDNDGSTGMALCKKSWLSLFLPKVCFNISWNRLLVYFLPI